MRYYVTLGPACNDAATITSMVKAGATGFRVNLSHGSLESFSEWIDRVRQCSLDAEILMDLQGPCLRIGHLPSPLLLEEGSVLHLGAGGVPCPVAFLDALAVGQTVSLDDHKIMAQVAAVSPGSAFCIVRQGGTLYSAKSIAAPGTDIEMPTLTDQDMISLRLAPMLGVTGVMLPFVRRRSDLDNLHDALYQCGAEKLKVFAKLESLEGLQNLASFVDLADEIIIARGDLADQVPLWLIPRFQKQIGQVCLANGVPYMVVTQLLESMNHSPTPTRAEMADIYNAVLEGASSLMLTGETATGEYPAQAVRYLVKAAEAALEDLARPNKP